ncbi:MAG TPA: lamin tail domain-containing protein, partial [Saprospiraceae bacterium]|nr:lamin tail domain-containing protein [Saprospiraceae bacterium]
MRHTLTFLLGFGLNMACCQWQDAFDQLLHPDWVGDRNHFAINGQHQLQLQAPASGSSSLFRAFPFQDSISWEFYFKMDFAPSASNRLAIILMSDLPQPDSGSAYGLEIGENGSEDRWRFYFRKGTEKILLADGQPGRMGADPAVLRMRIILDPSMNWSFYTDYQEAGNWFLEDTAVFAQQPFCDTCYYGLSAYYSETRKDRYVFDDIRIGRPLIDTIPPEIIRVSMTDEQTLQLYFSEALDWHSAVLPERYWVDTIGHPIRLFKQGQDQLQLEFASPFQWAREYVLHYDSLSDRTGNIAKGRSISFVSDFLSRPDLLDLRITEFMADPSPSVALPEAEFIELKNTSGQPLELEGCILSDESGRTGLPSFRLEAEDYLILCAAKDSAQLSAFGKVLGLESFPSLNNAGDRIEIRNLFGEWIDGLQYDDRWYAGGPQINGGYSLELMDTGQPCKGSANWHPSQHFSGGTPGRRNSLERHSTDSDPPKMIRAYAWSPWEIKLEFDERLDFNLPYQRQKFSIFPSRSVATVDLVQPEQNALILLLDEPLLEGANYTVRIDSLTDCIGNPISLQVVDIVLPSLPRMGDLLWTEVLFNPFSGGRDFVEIYNKSDRVLSLKSLLIANPGGSELWYPVKTDRNILPGTYIALTPDVNGLKTFYPSSDSLQLIQTELPALDDEGGRIWLACQHQNERILLDSVQYEREWHHPFLHDPEGVSLEKISLKAPFGSRHEWQSSPMKTGYASPGRANSFLMDSISVSGEKPYRLSSNVITPNADGIQDYLVVHFDLQTGGYKFNLEVFDLDGVRKTGLYSGILAAEDQVVYHGEDGGGALLPVGNYVLLLEFIHPDGKRMRFRDR